MPRIMHVISGLGIGGAEAALYRLVSHAPHGSFQHSVVTLTSDMALGQRIREAGIEVIALDFKRSPILHFLSLIRLIRKRRPDIVQTWMYHADLIGGLAARLAGNRNVIWGIRTAGINKGGSRSMACSRQICAWLSFRLPRSIVCVAEAARKAHVAFGYDGRRMTVVPNGFDLSWTATPQQRAALRQQWGIGASDVIVGSVGRFHPVKDPENFIRAAGLLAAKQANVRFVMVGRGMDAGNLQLCNWIRNTGHAQDFILLGERQDVPHCLAAMDIFCLHSRTEGFPNAAGEAMAMGLPCVVTDVGDAALLVADTGAIVPAQNPDALARALQRMLLIGVAARQELGARGRARIGSEYPLERVHKRFEETYAAILQRPDHTVPATEAEKC